MVWLAVTWMTAPTDTGTLQAFYDLIHPFGMGWRGVVRIDDGADDGGSVSASLLCWLLGCVVVYAALFGTGYVLYGQTGLGSLFLGTSALAAAGLFRTLPRVGFA